METLPPTERCTQCGDETPHSVRIEMRTESQKRKNAKFSREPYRVTVCSECETEAVQRMNDE